MDSARHPLRHDHHVRRAGRDHHREIRQPEPRRAGHHVSGRLRGLCQRVYLREYRCQPEYGLLRRARAGVCVPRCDAWRPDLQLPHHQPARQPERDRPRADDLRHGRGELLRCVHPQRPHGDAEPRLQDLPDEAARALRHGRVRTDGLRLRLHGLCGHRAGLRAALLPQPHPCGPEPARHRRESGHRRRGRRVRHALQVSGDLSGRGHLGSWRRVLCARLQSGHLGHHRSD